MRGNVTRGGILAAVVGSAIAVAPCPAHAVPGDSHAATQRKLDELVGASPGAPGGEVVGGDRDGTWELTSGTAEVGAQRTFRPEDHVQIGSYTKTFVATVVLQLVADGRVRLDDPIESYLPGLVDGNGYDGNAITVRQVLQHKSGIADYLTPLPHHGGLYNPLLHQRTWTPAELVREALTERPHFAPGTRWEYSNTNYVIAGMLIEKVTGRWVGDEITDRLIKPLGLAHTSYPAAGHKAMPAPHANGYIGVRSLGVWIDVTEALNEPSYLGAAGTMVSTPGDMTTFAQALADGAVLPRAELAEMTRFTPITVDQKADGYGLGLYQLNLSCGGEAIGHYGGTAGFGEVTMATADGRHATVVVNSPLPALGAGMTTVLDSALCDGRA
ncbi:serine hydrolase domain-containing protein [Amycolatopsis sp. CA-230715]|uniref:serine hydrolase domain-containing protein n=1 Tax=Amycolatopsis sp. CA-230715 TaxID=2745196 RepID=UPI001C00E9D3|nr:serine hydrolase domain-containing protein [Amycolatopsis sp. CA-230715]QWF84134.1 D-alanyl-D-alanine carboxypeptidase [Amycolatopsis sp. CA-230715]